MFRALLLTLASLMACTPGLGRFIHDSQSYDFGGLVAQHVVHSTPFMHYLFSKPGCSGQNREPVYVFLEGDGQSWMRDGRVSEDPTPKRPVAVELMLREESCAVAVSRPCTFGLVDLDPLCDPSVWTIERYSLEAIKSLVSVIEQKVPRSQPVVLVGVSGGGLLGSYVAERIERVEALVTLGANLDLEAWVAHHGYTAEILSHTPPSPFPLRSDLLQLHVLAAEDRISPPPLTLEFLGDWAGAETLVLEGADHSCCWIREWPSIRRKLQQLIFRSARR